MTYKYTSTSMPGIFADLDRRFIGFDSLFDQIERARAASTKDKNYPPYSIIKIGESEHLIEMSVAGFKRDELKITRDGDTLTIVGRKAEQDGKNYIHKGTGQRSFEKKFTLADDVEITQVDLEDGILSIYLLRKEDKQVTDIPIGYRTEPEQLNG